jgi:uncharacterized protein with HEPN domain
MAHRYFDAVHAQVWATVDHDLDPLLTALDRLADRLGPAPNTEPG